MYSLSEYFILVLSAPTELCFFSTIIMTKLLCTRCRSCSIDFLLVNWWKLWDQWNEVLLWNHWEMESRKGLKRTIIAQGWKSDSLNDQLGQKLSWDVSGFNGFHRAALIQACRHSAKHRISKQRSPLITIRASASVDLHACKTAGETHSVLLEIFLKSNLCRLALQKRAILSYK